MTKKSQIDLLGKLQERIRKCKICGGYGHIRQVDSDLVKECSCLSGSKYELLVSHSGIPSKFLNLSLVDYQNKDSAAYKQIVNYVAQAEKSLEIGAGLVIVGTQRAGKSLLGIGILKELMKRGYSCGYTAFGNLLGELGAVEKYIDPDIQFSCIDDVSKVLDGLSNFKITNLTLEKSHGAVEILDSVISRRLLHNSPTILTSSVNVSSIEKVFPRFGVLLMGNFLEVVCDSDDFKGTKAQDKLKKEFGFDQII